MTAKSSIRKALGCILFLVVSLLSQGQQASIQVLDAQTALPVAGATLEIPGLGERQISNADGWINLAALNRGIHRARIAASGYDDQWLRIEITDTESIFRKSIFLQTAVLELDPLTVTATLSIEDEATLRQRSSPTPGTELTGEALKEVSDDAVTDALEKVAGVTVSSEDGEASGVSIRGAGAKQTRITVDGQGLGGGGSRGTTRGVSAMNRIPREFLDRIQVMKATTPDMDADAIGGTINLQTTRVSRLQRSKSSLSFRNTFLQDPQRWSHRINMTHAQPIELEGTDRRMGILIGASADQSANGMDALRVLNQWPLREDPDSGVSYPILARLRTTQSRNKKEGYSLTLNTDLQLNRQTQLFLKTFWSESSVDFTLESLFHDFIRGNPVKLSATRGSFQRMRLEKQFLERPRESTVGSVVFGVNHRSGSWKYDGSIGYSSTETTVPDSRLSIFQTGRDFSGVYNLEPDWERPLVAAYPEGDPGNTEASVDPAAYRFNRYDLLHQEAADAELALQMNAVRIWTSGPSEWTFKTGLKGRFREADIDQDKLPYFTGETAFSMDIFPQEVALMPFDGRYSLGPTFSSAGMASTFAESPDAFRLDELTAEIDSARSDFAVSENIHAAYFMFQRKRGPWLLLSGLRVEQTRLSSEAFRVEQSRIDGTWVADIEPVSVQDDYIHLFPGLHGLFQPNERLVMRASLTRTLQRPDFRDLSPSLRVNLENKRIRAGNPDLNPFDAIALDVGLDAVVNGWTSVSLGGFYKEIDDFIVDVEEETTYQGEPGFIISQPVNGSPARIIGIEAALSTTLQFLPEPLSRTAFNMNYTWTDSSADYPGHPGVVVIVPEQVEQVFNANLRWRSDKWVVSVNTRYRGLQLRNLVRPGEDHYMEGFWTFNFSLTYQLTETLSLSFAANRINQPRRTMYQGSPGQMISHRNDSRAFAIGLNLRLGS